MNTEAALSTVFHPVCFRHLNVNLGVVAMKNTKVGIPYVNVSSRILIPFIVSLSTS